MKFLVEEETDRVRFTRLKRRGWQMVSTRGGKLYRVDDCLAVKDRSSGDALIIYPYDGTQPKTCTGIKLDSDLTRAYIDSSKIAKTSRDVWGRLSKISIEKVLTIMVVGGGLIWYLMNLIGI